MFRVKRDIFFSDFPLRQNLPLTPRRRAALEFLLTAIERDTELTMVRELAYILATIRWETGHTFEPVREKRASRERQPRLWESQQRYWRHGFYGRGFVQLTWEENYRKAGQKLAGQRFVVRNAPLAVDPDAFVRNPDALLEPDVSYVICARGMREGWFTGRKLGQFIADQSPADYFNARRVINGLDKAEHIAGLASGFELLLRASL